MNYKSRLIKSQLDDLLEVFSIVSVNGPRQAGKSTFIKHYIDDSWVYYSLDDQSLLSRVKDDPELFVQSFQSNVVIDEVQKAPTLFHSLKRLVDDGFSYKIILSGSANFLLMESITESLAGRVGLLEMSPFSLAEYVESEPIEFFNLLASSTDAHEFYKNATQRFTESVNLATLHEFIFDGGFPKLLHLSSAKAKRLWLSNYVSTYLERDVRALAQVADLDLFQRVYRIAGYQTGNVLNMSSFATDVGLSVQTVKKYLSVLQTSYQCALLPSYHFNQTKQVTKAPKIYYWDTGLVNLIMNNNDHEAMMNGGSWGALVETYVYSQFHKGLSHADSPFSMYYWRTNNRAEVDFVLESSDLLIPVEVKAGTRIRKQSIQGLKRFSESQKNKRIPLHLVIYGGHELFMVDDQTIAFPLNRLLL